MKKTKHQCDKSCFMCRLCVPEWMPAVDSNTKVLTFKKGQVVFEEGKEVLGMYFVLSGTLKVHKKWGDGKELIIRIAAKGDIAGHRGLGADNIYPVSATALEEVSVCYLDLSFFEATMKVNPIFLYELMMFFATELKVSERKMRDLAHMSVKGRLAQTLLSLHKKFGEDAAGNINLALSRQDLASFVGTTYETVFRTINELSEEGVLKTEGKSISIVEKNKLIGLLDGLSSYY